MNLPNNFSEEDWKIVSTLPSMIGGATAVAGNSGIFGTLKEAIANVQSMMQGSEKYPNNELIQALKPTRENMQDFKAMAKERREEMMGMMKERGVKSPEALLELTLEETRKANEILSAHVGDQTAQEFKNWVIEVAVKVSEAAKEGSTFGFGRTLVSENEEKFINDLRAILE